MRNQNHLSEIVARLLSNAISEQTPALVLVVRENDRAIVDAALRPFGEVIALLRLSQDDQKQEVTHE